MNESPLSRLITLVHEGLQSMECKTRKGCYPLDSRDNDKCCGACWSCLHVRDVRACLADLSNEHAKSLSNSPATALVNAMLELPVGKVTLRPLVSPPKSEVVGIHFTLPPVSEEERRLMKFHTDLSIAGIKLIASLTSSQLWDVINRKTASLVFKAISQAMGPDTNHNWIVDRVAEEAYERKLIDERKLHQLVNE